MHSKNMEPKLASSKKYAIPDYQILAAAIFSALLFIALIRSHSSVFDESSLIAQEFRTGPDVRLAGEILEDKDTFGHRKYSGSVQNYLTWRVDFVRLEFRLFNKAGILLLRKDIFIDGAEYRFQDGTVSHSSLDPGKKGNFICLTPIRADSIFKFEQTIYWMEYDSLPEQAF